MPLPRDGDGVYIANMFDVAAIPAIRVRYEAGEFHLDAGPELLREPERKEIPEVGDLFSVQETPSHGNDVKVLYDALVTYPVYGVVLAIDPEDDMVETEVYTADGRLIVGSWFFYQREITLIE